MGSIMGTCTAVQRRLALEAGRTSCQHNVRLEEKASFGQTTEMGSTAAGPSEGHLMGWRLFGIMLVEVANISSARAVL